MRLLPLSLALALAACASKPKLPDPGPGATSQQPIPTVADASDERVVAFLDGRPITWRDVTEHAMIAGGKQLIDEYIRWRLRHDVSKKLGVTNTPEDIRAGCTDSPPLYPWRRAELRLTGLSPVMQVRPPRPRRPRRARPAAPPPAVVVASDETDDEHEETESEPAEPPRPHIHARARAVMAARAAWSRMPHPNRPYCH